ncbi:MAG: transposase [Firmicutes bacterium]|nr:transposase [Bacillota bacterium]
MLLTEEHRIKKDGHKSLFRELDDLCFRAKNLHNAVNYLIKQIGRIHRKIRSGEVLEAWEKEMADQVNEGIRRYNTGRAENKQRPYVDADNGFIADAYFLSWYLKSSGEYKAMPYATCSQICIQELCRSWKSYHKAMPVYLKNPGRFTGRPQKPGYLDPKEGRGWLVITSQNFTREEDGLIRMPGFLKGIRIKARHSQIRQIRIKTERTCIRILLVYEEKEKCPAKPAENVNVMGIDLGVNNLITAVWTSNESPVIISGRPLKSINQFYNLKKACLQAAAQKGNGRKKTRRMDRLTRKRNSRVKDTLHKASRKIVDLAEKTGVGVIIIGNNKGWKQNVNLGNRTNQNFVSIPHRTLIEMIRYKAALRGIEVRIVEEAYTSGTSYLDGEMPSAPFYDRSRRAHRGLFRSNTGIFVNADVNAAYQILKAGGIIDLKIKQAEPVRKIKAA